MSDARPDDPPHSIPLTGASNVRELGGYRSRDGRKVRRGMIYRSAALARLTEDDLPVMRGLHLRTICDFRGVKEREAAPTAFHDARNLSLPIEPTIGAGLRDILATRDATGQDLMGLLRTAYQAYALEAPEAYRTLFELLEQDGMPVLFHCSAGKDRTGFGAAIVLAALDVPWDTILADYLATNRLWRRDTVASSDLPPELRTILLGAHAELLEAAFDAIRERHGSVEAYLDRMFGLRGDRLVAFRGRLLE